MSTKADTDFFGLLNDAAETSLAAAQMFREAMSGSEPPAAYIDRMKDLEHKGDTITHSMYRGLNKVFITPIDREDIMSLTNAMDDVIDEIEDVLARFDYLVIDHADDYMKQFAEIIVKSCEHIVEAFKLLSKKKYSAIREHTVAINSAENEGDHLMRKGIKQLFQNPQDPLMAYRRKEMYEHMEQATDACERVANALEGVVLRYG